MTAREAPTSRTRPLGGAVRWTRTAVIALFAALAVLVHHETAAAAVTAAPSSAAHVTHGMPGMVMPDGGGGQAIHLSGHSQGSAAVQGAEATAAAPTPDGTAGLACSGMAMQHCAPASIDVVKLVPPTESRMTWDVDPYKTAIAGPEPAGTVGRAPPDLSVLSQLRI